MEGADYARTIREVARLSECSIGAVAKTNWWKGYLKQKISSDSRRFTMPSAKTRQRRRKGCVEGRVIQIAKEASSRNDFSLSARKVAEMIGCSKAAVGKTRAWKGYVDAREADKETARSRRKGQRIK